MKQKPFLIVLGLVSAGFITYFVVHAFANQLLQTEPKRAGATCGTYSITHFVNITEGVATPNEVTGKLCDKLSIINHDDRIRLMAFGVHDSHQAYDGTVEKPLQKGESLTVTLNKAGTYRFHDHIDDQAQGIFTVRN